MLACLALAALWETGCSDINNANPPQGVDGIKSVVPARAPYGARVVIGGQGLGDVQQVLFNGTDADIEAASDSAILTRVPLNATTGPIEVMTGEETFTGPDFTVDSTKNLFLTIDAVFPTTVRVQDTVRISGTGFNTTSVELEVGESLAKNNFNNSSGEVVGSAVQPDLGEGIKMPDRKGKKQVTREVRKLSAQPEVYFNDEPAKTVSVSDTLIITTVPKAARSGLLSVIVEADTAIGPEMTILRHAISGISPTSGAVGSEVTISGSDFSSLPVNNMVSFNGTEAEVLKASTSELVVEVPKGATSGEVTVTINNMAVTGPVFTVVIPAPVISSISPKTGVPGTEVTISGANFSPSASGNTVLFGGEEATIISASEKELIVKVPEGAGDGPVEVQVNDQSVTGPVFDVITSGDLIVLVSTTGAELDANGYLISVDGAEGERVAINDTLSQTGLEEGTHEVDISDIESNCFTTGDFPNPRTVEVSPGETATIEYNISCEGTNEPPVALFTSTCTNLTCDFDASGSTDSDGSVEKYDWIFDDGSTGSGQTVSHHYEIAGTYTVQLTVTDDEDATAMKTEEIILTAPKITELSPSSGPIGTEVSIIGSGFSGTASENTVSFTSGSATVNAAIKSASESKLVVDVPGDATTGPIQVTVNGYTVEGPEFTIEVLGNLEVITKTTGSDFDADGYLVTVQGIGEQTAQVNDTLRYNDINVGSYQVGISDIASNCQLSEEFPNPRTVDVNQNTTTSTTLYVFCSAPNEPPVAEFTTDCTNLTCNFDASGSTDSDGTISSFEWTFGDGLKNSGQTTNHSYEVPGTYTVELTVTDDDGSTDSLSKDITVTLPEITSISPQSGPTGTEVTITGGGFSSTASENVVEFNGDRAELNGASETELIAIVPGSATTGPVSVTVDGYKVNGPTFTVQVPKTLEVVIESEGTEIDPDGYTLSVTGESDRLVKVNDDVMYSGIYDNSVEVQLSGAASNCRVDGDNPRTVNLNNSDNAGFTSFTVDCTKDLRDFIVFELTENGGTYSDIYVRNENRTVENAITNTANASEIEPVLSPNGLSIAYSDGRYIYVMDSDGSDIRQIIEDGYNTSPAWSPKGDEIVFERFVSSEIPDLYVMNKDGSGLRNITNTESIAERDPDWSPDGELITYASNAKKSLGIYTIRPDGSEETALTASASEDSEPEWSPSGDRIAFTRFIQDLGSKVYIMKSDGSSATELTPSSMEEGSPSWSPDGTKMAYEVRSDGVYQIYIFSIEFNDVINTYFTFSDDESPHWNYK